MCGIAGVFHQSAEQDVELMLNKLGHRGPDGRGIKNLPLGTLGHSRLAVLDGRGGRQPMGIDETWITFDGEIYNYRELALEHLPDVSLQTNSDTEVLLRLYLKFGPRCVEFLDGRFAFAISNGKELFMARDPLGIKPLYCSVKHHAFYFASEIKALAEVAETVHEFPAGYWFHSRAGWHAYFDIDSVQEDIDGASNTWESIRSVLREAVRKRLLADGPVGVSLSGGLDSSIIAALARQETEHIHSFSAGMQGSEDLAFARKVAGILDTQHHERIYTEQEVLSALPKIIYHLESFDPALVRAAIPTYFLAELASKYVKVILTGEGADEIYAGYDYFGSIKSSEDLQNELIDITAGLHNTNLQRIERIPMAFGLEARVPFLDIQAVKLGFCLPADQKMHRKRPAKYLLRQAFRDDLPKEILDRPKRIFSEGAGSSDIILAKANDTISDEEFQSEHARLLNRWGYRLPNKEALYYYRLSQRHYEDRLILPTLGRSHSL